MATKKPDPTKKPDQSAAAPEPYQEPTTASFPWRGLALPDPMPAPTTTGLEVIAPPHHRPMIVRAVLREGVVGYGEPIHLDGILQAAAVQEHLAHGGERLPDMNHMAFPLDVPIPLSRWRVAPVDGERPWPKMLDQGRLWGWCASAQVWDVAGQGLIETRKRTPLAAMATWSSHRRVDTAAGVDKPWDLSRPVYLPARGEVFWCAHGDVERVWALLSGWVRHIGKLRTQGNGAVMEDGWTVREIPEAHDMSLFAPSGAPTRTLPARALIERGPFARLPTLGGMYPMQAAVRAPYQHDTRRVLAVKPLPLAPAMLGLEAGVGVARLLEGAGAGPVGKAGTLSGKAGTLSDATGALAQGGV